MPLADITIYYMDIRAFGKGFEEFYDRVRDEGVRFKRGKPSEIFKHKDKLAVRVDDTLLNEVIEHDTDLVVLGVGRSGRASLPVVVGHRHFSVLGGSLAGRMPRSSCSSR